MRALTKFVVILLVCLLPATAAGQQYTRYRLPEGTRLTVRNTTYQGFTLAEYTDLLRIDEDLRYFTARATTLDNQVTELTTASVELRRAVDACDQQKQILFDERLRLGRLLREENRLRHKAENAVSWSWIPWSIAGGLAIATTILSIIVGVQ